MPERALADITARYSTEGHGPTLAVVRLTTQKFLLDARGLATTYDPELLPQLNGAAPAAELEALADQHVASWGDVAVVVMDHATWSKWPQPRRGNYVLLSDALRRAYKLLPRWVTNPSGAVAFRSFN